MIAQHLRVSYYTQSDIFAISRKQVDLANNSDSLNNRNASKETFHEEGPPTII